MSDIFTKFLLTFVLFAIAQCRSPPSLRIKEKDPSFTEGEMISIHCWTEILNISNVRFQLSNNFDQSLARLAEEIRDKTRILNSTHVVLETEATMKWDGILLDCCNGNSCLDQVKIKICYAVPNVTITSFKIFDWKDLFIQWSVGSDRPGIMARVWYKIDIHSNSEDNFTECTKTGNNCTVSGFYQGLGRVDVALSALVVLSNMCGSKGNDSEGPFAPENIVQMRPVQNLRADIVHSAFNSTEGFVNVYFSVQPPSRMVQANLKCECASEDYKVDKTLGVTNSSTSKLTNLPVFVNCTCQVKVRSLGFWSEAAFINFMSPQTVPKRNPNLIAFHKKHCSSNTVEVTLFVEDLSEKESRGTLEYMDVTTEPCQQCHLLPQDTLDKCQNSSSYGCSRRIEYWPYLVLSSTSETINVSLKAENKAGAYPMLSHQTIDLDVKDVVTNFSVIRTENGNFTLSWDFRDGGLPASVIVVWCQWNFQNCQWKNLDSSSTSYTINSSIVGGQSTVFGVAGRPKIPGAIPPLHLKNNICLINALPLAPSIGLNRLATPNAFINFYQPGCNYTGLPYLQKVQLLRVDEATNKTDVVSELEIHAGESLSEDVVLEIPDVGSNYMIQAFSISQGGLSQSSNRIDVNLSDQKSSDVKTTTLASVLVPLFAFLLVTIITVYYCWRQKNSKKISISLPKDDNLYEATDPHNYSTIEPLRNASSSSCGSRSNESIEDLPRAEDVALDKASLQSKTASISSEPDDYQLATVGTLNDDKPLHLNTSRGSADWYQKCGKMNQMPIVTPSPDTYASPISNFESDSVFKENSFSSSELKELSEYSRVTLDGDPVSVTGLRATVV